MKRGEKGKIRVVWCSRVGENIWKRKRKKFEGGVKVILHDL